MKDRQKIVSLYVDRHAFESGGVDVTERFHQEVPADQVETIKYMMPNATEQGIYFTIVYLPKEDKAKGVMGFMGGETRSEGK
jgi:hypothetical protein